MLTLTLLPSILMIPLIVTVGLAVLVIKKKLILTELLAVFSGGAAGFLIGLVATNEVSWGLAQMGALIGSTVIIAVLFTAHAVKAILREKELK